MLRQILGAIAGYIAMFVFIFAAFSILYITLGADGAFREGTYDVSVLWIAVTTVLNLIAAILGGYIAAAIGKSGTAVKILAGIVLVLGLLTIVAVMNAPEALGPRTAEISNLEAMGMARTPVWASLLALVTGVVGVFIGGSLRKQN